MKEAFSIIKKIWSNKRYRALGWLVFYFFFFLAIIVMTRPSSGNNYEDIGDQKTVLDQFNFNYSYTRKVTISRNEDVLILNNTNYDEDIYNVLSDSSNELVEGSNFYEAKENYIIDLAKFNNQYIYSYIDLSTLDYETNFTDGRIEKSYRLAINDFNNLYNDEELINDSAIIITTTEENNSINKVEFDLTNYVMLIDDSINKFIIEFNYKENE